jgi:predicted PurR-regulated permease PerM
MQQTNKLQQVTENVLPQGKNQQKPIPVKIQNSGNDGMIQRNLGTLTEIALTAAFVPFLVYFMLSWQEHARTKTVQLFPQQTRTTAYVTLGQISLMMRSFITGNFIVGVFLGICSLVVFGFLKLPYFYFLGFISGFLSLVPYLGVVLALVPPLTAGIGNMTTSSVMIIIVTVAGLHLLAMNVLYPKVIGSRLQLNPLVVTIGLLIWGFIWGAMGLILAVPMLGAIKIICDHVPSLRPIGAWMGE